MTTTTRMDTTVPAHRQNQRQRQLALRIARSAAITVLLVVTCVPLFWVVVTAFKPNPEVLIKPVQVLPRTWTLDNIAALFTDNGSLNYLLNSTVATLGSTVLVILVATPAAYAIGRYHFPARIGEGMSLSVLAARFIPAFMLIIPVFLIFKNLQLLDTVQGLVLAYTVMNLPLAIWVILPAATQLPNELMEAAAVDGASITRTFFQVGLPLLRPAIATAATLSMIFAWNEFFTALIFTHRNAQTAPLLISKFIGDFGVLWGSLAANALIVALPMIFLGVVAQRHLVRGLTAGAVK